MEIVQDQGVITPHTSSSVYTEYKSDYDTEISLDKTYVNKLCNNACEEDELFKLKNDFFVNYGNELFIEVVELYTLMLGKLDLNSFDTNIWDKCMELYNEQPHETVRCFCFQVKFNVKHSHQNVYDTYLYLLKMKIKNIKIKTWLSAVHHVKHK